ncbi:SH3-containing GRB2-like protein 3-interacting protein 1 isoform X2 [Pseudophryne corroboree]|uniref:SH3-containing GRB2-like protein 3-interacting protein 1 isoform X2 n=1 Tax=Pseudophryne corroboree TaxID=495146 RepID=UPI0030820172
MMEGLKKRTRKAFGIRKKEKDTDSTGSPDRDTVSKKANGAPNGFYAEIDWERYNSPEVDEEGYSIRPEEPGSTKAKHFYSSSESEEEQEARKKFNIRIKPLQAKDSLKSAATVDELKASIGNIALSPSPVRRSPGTIKRKLSTEEIARPRRSTPTAELASKKAPVELFGPPLESAFEGPKSEVPLDQSEIWGAAEISPEATESPKLSRPFPAGTPPPIPPKNIPATPPRTASPLPSGPDQGAVAGDEQRETDTRDEQVASIHDLDSIFGPVLSPRSVAVTSEDKWVRFLEPSPEQISPPSPPPPTPTTKAESPPAEEPESPCEPPPPTVTCRNIPSPLNLEEVHKKMAEQSFIKEDILESAASPKDVGLGQRATPPPPPPPTYRTVVSSPGPSGSASGTSSPARPATPLAACSTTPPPPPPRPPSRPKLPPGKPTVTDVSRPFSPPVHSSSPPPIAPLARAESTSSISSATSLSAATTPTVEGDAFADKRPSFDRREAPAAAPCLAGSSRGPSPLTMGAQDTLPVAAAFTETVNAYFKGADPNKCIVKVTGEMVLSFPAGITRHFSNNPAPAALTFRITNYSRLEHVLPNPQLLCCDNTQPTPNAKEFWVNMPNLMTHLKKVSEQKPQATYYNVDMLKYQVSSQGLQSTPLNLAVNWRCDPTSTDLRIDYKYNPESMTTLVALNNVQFVIPIDGGVTKLQAVLPPAVWNAEQQRILWKIPDISQKSENGGVGSLLARFQLSEGPSKPAPLAVQFTSEGTTLSGCDIELVGGGYRFSLIKKRFAAGKYLADA